MRSSASVRRSSSTPPIRASATNCDERSGPVELEPEQADQRLGVADAGDRMVEVVERPGDDLDALVVLGGGVALGEARGVEDVDDLVHDSDRGDVLGDALPALGRLADLLGQLALGGVDRGLPVDVQAAGGQLE